MSVRKILLCYQPKDSFRATKIKKMKNFEQSVVFAEEDWPTVANHSETEIQEWVDQQVEDSDCLVVLIGEETAKKQWMNYSIKRAYELNKGIVGIFVHRLLDEEGDPSERGDDPFHYLDLNGIKFSRFIQRFESKHVTERYVYHDIRRNLPQLIERALENPPSTWEWDIYR